jgi:SAM-dependent MidA family methyltransferase
MEISFDRVRRSTVDPATVESDPALVSQLVAEIERGGPMTFARFMEVALYDPDRGYYTSATARPTREGDFLTAPELHPAFGRLVGRQLAEIWERLGRPDPFVVREHGAGAGTLGLTALEGLLADGSALVEAIRYQPIEVNRHRRAEMLERFEAADLADRIAEPSGRIVGVVLANELLDALPVHRVETRDGALLETFVDWDGSGFLDRAGPPSTPALAERLAAEGVALAEGQRAEICLAIGPWVAGVAADLVAGCLLVVDYGHPAPELYGPARADGTLRAYIGHRVHDDPYRHIGRQDLTAHVDVTALERAAETAGLTILGRTSQAEFLTGLGLGDLLAEAGRSTTAELASYLELRGAVVRLVDPRAMGAFRVVAAGRGIDPMPPLAGFSFRLPPRPGVAKRG